jgi:VCBS repeat-containing protein
LTLDGDVATYTPDPNFVGEDSFTFTANDGTVDSDMAVVDITVTPVNDAPVAVEDAYNVDEDTVLTVLVADGVLDNDSDVDGDPLTAVLVGDVSNGTLVLDDDGSFVYTPDENYFGSDSFTYKASDGTLESDTVTVTITVNSINDWVIANDDEYETMAGVTLEVAAPGVLTNDVLLDPNETVSLQVLTQPAGGTLTLNTDGSFTYVPNAGFFGVDTFEYQLNSTQVVQGEFSDIALVTITVTARQIFLPLILR